MAGKGKIVVASQRGTYGGTTGGVMRYPGERFAITDEKHFSKRWMIDVNNPGSDRLKEELRTLEAAYKSSSTSSRTRDVSDEQLLSELAEAGGMSAALTQENTMLKARLAKLEAQIAGEADGEKEPEVGPAGENSEGPAKPEPETADSGDDKTSRAADGDTPRRPSRRAS